MSPSEGSLSRSMANLRQLRLHLRAVWSRDTRSILLQPMGRMERTDSRPRNALIHRESGSPCMWTMRTHQDRVSASERTFPPIRRHLCAAATPHSARASFPGTKVRISAQSHASKKTLLELRESPCICSEPQNLQEKLKVWWGHGTNLAPAQLGGRHRRHHLVW